MLVPFNQIVYLETDHVLKTNIQENNWPSSVRKKWRKANSGSFKMVLHV